MVLKTGHRARFGRDFGTGGAENGTPGTLEREKGAARRSAAEGNENGQTLGPVRNKYIKVFGQ